MSALNNKNVIYGVAGGLLIVLAGGYFYASSRGVEEFEDFLYDNDLTDAIRYDDASYSPLSDSISLEDVELNIVLMKFGGEQQKITGRLDRLTLEGAQDENRRLLSFSGYQLVTEPTPDQIRDNALYQMLAEPLRQARMLGVTETRLAGTVGYAYERDDEKLTLTAALDADGLGRQHAELRLQRARKLFEIEPSEFILAAMLSPQSLMQDLGRIELLGADAELEDYGAFRRRARLSALESYNYATALNEDIDFDAVEAAMHVNSNPKMDQQAAAEDLDEDSIEALRGFAEKGGDLNIEIETERPVRFADLVKDDRLHRDISIVIDD